MLYSEILYSYETEQTPIKLNMNKSQKYWAKEKKEHKIYFFIYTKFRMNKSDIVISL